MPGELAAIFANTNDYLHHKILSRALPQAQAAAIKALLGSQGMTSLCLHYHIAWNNARSQMPQGRVDPNPFSSLSYIALLLATILTIGPSTETNTATTQHQQADPYLRYDLVQSALLSRMTSCKHHSATTGKAWVLPPTVSQKTRQRPLFHMLMEGITMGPSSTLYCGRVAGTT